MKKGIIFGIGFGLIIGGILGYYYYRTSIKIDLKTTVSGQSRSYSDFYQKDCLLCQIITKREPALILYEDDRVVAIEKKPVRSPVNCLIVPKKHIENFKFLDETNTYDQQIVGYMVTVANKLSQKLTGSKDFKIIVNNGAGVGQTLPHLHMHFVSPEHWI